MFLNFREFVLCCLATYCQEKKMLWQQQKQENKPQPIKCLEAFGATGENQTFLFSQLEARCENTI